MYGPPVVAANFGPGMSAAPGTPGWTPPPKPGLVPLRPMTLGTILGASFQTLRRNPRATLAPSLVISVITTTIQVIGLTAAATSLLGGISSSASSAGAPDIGGALLPFLVSTLVPLLLGVLGQAILQGIIVLEVARGTLGERQKLGTLLGRLRGRMLGLIGFGFAVTGAIILGAVVILGISVLLFSLGTAAVGFGLLWMFVGGVGLAVIAFWLGTKTLFTPSAIVLEGMRFGPAVRRSWRLTRGYFWRTLGIQLLVNAMIALALQFVTTPISLIFSFGGGLLTPNGTDPTASITGTLVLSYIVIGVVTALFGAVGAVVTTATTSLMYIDLRMRSEGLDLDLARYVEARAAGATGLPDPYASKAAPQPAAPAPPEPRAAPSPWG